MRYQQSTLHTPLLSRLLDDNPQKNYDGCVTKFVTSQQLYKDIRNNLENILNARALGLNWPTYQTQLDYSLLNYGLTDFTQHHFSNNDAQQQLCQAITTLINHFEPRLMNVEVTLLDNELELERLLKIRIAAAIDITPSPIATIFESAMDISHHQFSFDNDDE